MNRKNFYGRDIFAKKATKICLTVFAIAWIVCMLIAHDIVVAAIVSAVPTLIVLIILTAIQIAKEHFMNMAMNLFVSMDYNERRYNREL